MTETIPSLARRVELLFECVTHPDGRPYTYDEIRRIADVDPSTISRLRTGRILDPTFSNVARIARAFDVSLDYFVLDTDEANLRRYLSSSVEREKELEQMRSHERQQIDKRVQVLAHRASHLDEDGIEAVVGMINYVLQQKGIQAGIQLGTEEKPMSVGKKSPENA